MAASPVSRTAGASFTPLSMPSAPVVDVPLMREAGQSKSQAKFTMGDILSP